MRIVINKCYGGFGISGKALLELMKRGSKCVKSHKFNYLSAAQLKKEIDLAKKVSEGVYETLDGSILDITNPHNRVVYELDRECNRTDHDLVEVVERLGAEANGPYSNLMVVTCLYTVEPVIDNYDGKESVTLVLHAEEE